jgi:hypothetical protein
VDVKISPDYRSLDDFLVANTKKWQIWPMYPRSKWNMSQILEFLA